MPLPAAPPHLPLPNLAVLHVDAQCVVLVKPAGLLAVPGRGEDKQDCVIHRLQTRWPEARVVHRLDMATSGLMVFALDAASHVALNRQFAERQVAKRYSAVVAGLVAQDTGEINLPLICDWPNRPRQMVDAERGKPSLTHYAVLARDTQAGRTRVALTPVTGRTHQLRVHLLALGHPIVGDALYANAPWDTAAGRLLLHADQLQFTQPHSGQTLRFEAPAPF
ncbi:MAG: hypothetical protein RJA98_3616 [Pseudomonadota bacterium]|jgi:tRNA pseudouridine32 synthase/23S rRNA pseudouridine746 synthase